MNFKKFGRTANLFDKTTADLNYFTNSGTGEKEKLTNYFATDYIRVESGKTYYWQDVQFRNNAGAFYDSNKEYVSGLNTNTLQTYYFTVPTGCEYVRLTGSSSHIEDTMLNTGSTALPYQPYMDWTNTPYYIHNTSTDTITTLPADLYADGNNATVGLKGNMQQTGAPTPTTPIQPSECGERTAQLFDYQAGTPTPYKCLDENGNEIEVAESAPWYITDYIPIPDGTLSVTLSKIGGGAPAMCAYDASKNYITGIKYNTGSAVTKVDVTLTSSTPIRFIRFSYFLGNMGYDDLSTKMLNTGTEALPYSPYGFKIPISSANTTTPVYLGEVETTRKIKKYICTGDETVDKIDNNIYYLSGALINSAPILRASAICTHYENNPVTSGISANLLNGQFTINQVGSGNYSITIHDDINGGNVSAQYKQYLAAQYAAGTPVTVWYVLATEETGIVNEPLCKIGDYADEVSGITIPTIAGANTLSVGTTLQPSEVTVNYKGWHPVQSVYERENGQWD